MRRGEIWRYAPVVTRAGQSTTRLIVSADAINASVVLPTVYVMHMLDTDPESLLAVRIGNLGWASALQIDRPTRSRLTEQLGTATREEMDQIDNALRAAFEL